MAKKQQKRQFDWRTYSKPERILSPAQEDAFSAGILRPLLDLASTGPEFRFDIRARSANVYYRGASLVRVSGEGPFVAEIDNAGGGVERFEIAAAADVSAVLARIQEDRDSLDEALAAGTEQRNERAYEMAIAAGNDGADLWEDALVVIDTEYALGKRKIDLVALGRTEGVTGPGGFANPLLVFVDLRVPGQPIGGSGGLAAVAGDLAEFVKALGGEHLQRTREELTALVAQKVRLGLLPADLEVRAIDDRMPQLLVAFAEYDIAEPVHDVAIIELHEKLTARHFPTERLRFVDFTMVPPDGDGLALGPDDAMNYREFKAYRTSGR